MASGRMALVHLIVTVGMEINEGKEAPLDGLKNAEPMVLLSQVHLIPTVRAEASTLELLIAIDLQQHLRPAGQVGNRTQHHLLRLRLPVHLGIRFPHILHLQRMECVFHSRHTASVIAIATEIVTETEIVAPGRKLILTPTSPLMQGPAEVPGRA